jgi:diguanylate cyclase (GGDEF)-like protein/PAS domain S-box-containing protein
VTRPVLTDAAGVPVESVLPIWRALAECAEPSLAVVGPPAGPHVVAWVNRTALELLGVEPAELVGRTLGGLREGPGAGWALAATELLAATGGRREAVVRRYDEQSQAVDVVVTAVHSAPAPTSPPPGAADAGRAWLVALRPLGEGDEAAEALHAAEHRFRALADHAPVGILLSEAGLRLGYANSRFAELAGMDAERLLGTGWLDAIHSQDLPGLYQMLQAVLCGDVTEPVELTVRLVATEHAQRYLALRFSPTTTPRRAAGFVGTAEDITERRAWQEQIAYQAHHDPLTGLVNRRRLVELVTSLLGSQRQRDREFALIFCDLDGFKAVNDTFGHAAGDRVLIEVARRLLRTAREDDVVARVSGDEFVIVLRGVASGPDAEIAANRHLAALLAPFVVNRTEVPLSASMGVALPATYDSAESLLQAADAVMYDAKASGPGNYRLAPLTAAGTSAAGGPAAPAGEGRE